MNQAGIGIVKYKVVKAKSPPPFHKVVETFMAGNGKESDCKGGKKTSPEKRKIPQGQAWSPSMGRRSVICLIVVVVVMEIIERKFIHSKNSFSYFKKKTTYFKKIFLK